jgi:tRNA pseudouridine13 synthase
MTSPESHFGIEHRLSSSTLAKSARIKSQPQDFCVNEIDLQGSVLVYSPGHFYDPSFLPPPSVKTTHVAIVPSLEELVKHLDCSEQTASNILQLYEAKTGDQVVIPDVDNKDRRRGMHAYVKESFGGRLVTDCPVGTRDLRISRRGGNFTSPSSGIKRPRYDVRNDKQPDSYAYVQFVVQKESLDTMDVVGCLARALHISPKDISFAGTKDRQAITTQAMCVRNLAVSKLVGIRERHPRIRLSHVRPAQHPINLGALQGNRFALVLRNVVPTSDGTDVDALVTTGFQSTGFINYYGRQRFGTQAVGTHDIGVLLLRSDFEGAARLLLQPKPDELEDIRAAKSAYLDGMTAENAQSLSRLLPRAQHIELALLDKLAEAPRDIQNAWMAVKRESRLLYVHAVQSYMWNRLASFRIARFGPSPIIGDLVMLPSLIDDGCKVAAPVLVTETNLKEVTIFDVVLPLLGEDVQLPKVPELQACLVDLLADLKLSPSFYRSPNKALWDLRGDYRKLIARPTNVESEFRGSDCTWRLSFDLPRSAYATMALRELVDRVLE